MAKLDPNPKSLDQAYDLGFCDGIRVGDTMGAENERLRAALLQKCGHCSLHQLAPDLNAMTRQRDIWKWAAIAALVLWVLWGGRA